MLPGNEDRVTLHQQVLLRNDMVLLLSVHNVLLLQALEGKGLGLVERFAAFVLGFAAGA